ncbi:MAG: hypothetical protein HUJ29_00955 [Gammaproteobacteria bacterium]|nr:hypothetical protein [Gammaproteobacteria bacterium]
MTLRIRIALDHTPPSRRAMEWAAQMAMQWQAPLEALFIEDSRLFEIAQLPFIRQIDVSGSGSAFDPDSLSHEIKRQSQSLEKALQELAERRELALEFRTVRGRVLNEIRRACEEVGLLIIQGRRSVSSLPRETVMAVFDGSEAAAEVLQIALRAVPPTSLHLLLQADTPEQAQALRAQVGQMMRDAGIESLPSSYLPQHDGDHLLHLATLEQPTALFVASNNTLLEDHVLEALSTRLPCPLAIVGQGM